MKNFFFILIIFLLNHKIFSSVFWVCTNNYGSDFEYNIVKSEVYIKKNNNWQLLYKDKIDKINTKERIIYVSAKTNKNILYKEIFDLKKLTIQIFSKSRDDNQSFELMSTRQCSLL
tara:strand:+ start:449 stop:796 length:348 start_codon:yes stop_codon:yes gene_type:complete